jgi:hypothetical protein
MRKLKANVSLTTVLVTSAIIILGSITVILNVVDMSRNSKNNMMYELNSMRSDSCIEESMHRIKYNPSFTGTVTITFEDGNCQSVVSIDPVDPNIRILALTAQIDDYYFSITKKADISQSPIYIFN